jgi:hypothetical protein
MGPLLCVHPNPTGAMPDIPGGHMTDSEHVSQADADAQSQADTSTDTATQADAAETLSLDDAKKLRSEAQSLRKRLKDAESKVQEIADAGKSEDEKQQAALASAVERAEAAERRFRESNARSVVYEAVGSLASPRAVFALIRDDIEYDDEDQPTNVAALIARERKADTTLFRAAGGSADGGVSTQNTSQEFSSPTERLSSAYDKLSKARR